MSEFNKRLKFKGLPYIAFKNDQEKLESAVETFFWIRDYLEAYSQENDGRTIRQIASAFDEMPEPIINLKTVSEFQWMDINRVNFWLVYVLTTIELSNSLIDDITRIVREKSYSNEVVIHEKLTKTRINGNYVKSVIKLLDLTTSLCINFWKYYS